MTIYGKVGDVEYEVIEVKGSAHPPVVRTFAIQETSGVWPPGLLVARDTATNELIQYVTDGSVGFFGVMDESVDLSLNGSGNCIIHGSVQAAVLKIGADTQAAPDDTLLMTMLDGGVYPE